MNAPKSHCGFVALLGAPNAGKSTLVNQMVGAKVSIVTHKVQTTRSRIRGIALEGDTQIVLVDTPGIFQPKRRLDRAMVHAAWAGAGDADVVVLVADARQGLDDDTMRIIEGLKQAGRKAVLALNKVDDIKREKLLPIAAEFSEAFDFERVFMISALNGRLRRPAQISGRADGAGPLALSRGRAQRSADAPDGGGDHPREGLPAPA